MKDNPPEIRNLTELLSAVFISAAVSYTTYLLFFGFSGLIWSLNSRLYPIDTYYTEWSKPGLAQHNGIQLYLLYIMMFIDVVLSFLLIKLMGRIRDAGKYYAFFLIMFAGAVLYFMEIGFFPPRNSIYQFSNYNPVIYLLITAIPLILFRLSIINKYLKNTIDILMVVALIPVCFVAAMRYSIYDYGYILEPALKIVKGFPLNEIYLQYDALLPVIAAVMMKAGIDYNYFQTVGMISLYLFYLGTYFFGRNIFYDKKMPLFLIFAMVMLCKYDVQNYSQLMPLRLDLWFGAFLLAYFYGFYSMITALYLAFLIIFSKAFGMIYLLAYLEAIFILFITGLFEKIPMKEWNTRFVLKGIKSSIKMNYKNLIILVLAYFINMIIFRKTGLEAAGTFTKVGNGFPPIFRNSFFWYIPVMLSVLIYMTFAVKKAVTEKYFNSVIFLALLAIGNSLYFFARSIEMNIVNLARIYLWVLFIMFDVMLIYGKERFKSGKQPKYISMAAWIMPAVFICLVAVYYLGVMKETAGLQLETIKKHQLIYYYNRDSVDIDAVKELTNSSKKVYFLTYQNDFLYYYYGDYTPVGYISPFTAWLYKKGLAVFLNSLLDKGYYLVADNKKMLGDLFDSLIFDTRKEKNSLICIYKKNNV